MRVADWQGDIVFLHEVMPGAADRSYGIHVAQLAGLPAAVTARARAILDRLETAARERPADAALDDLPLFAASGMASAPAVSRAVAPRAATLAPPADPDPKADPKADPEPTHCARLWPPSSRTR